jgi:hypothetical protein
MGRCRASFQKEFQGGWERASLRFDRAEIEGFGLSRSLTPKVWLHARALMFCYSLGIFSWSWVFYTNHGYTPFWFIYLTNWRCGRVCRALRGVCTSKAMSCSCSITLETVYFALATSITTMYYSCPPQDESDLTKRMLWFLRITWLIQNTVGPASVLVFILYWTLVWNSAKGVDVLATQVHGANFVLMLCDILLSTAPFRVLHAWGLYLYGKRGLMGGNAASRTRAQ